MVEYGHARSPAELTTPDDPWTVFSVSERRACVGLGTFAGKLAAKRAVVALLDLAVTADNLRSVEVLPDRDWCLLGAGHMRGQHPPMVRLHPDVPLAGQDLGLGVSITHCSGIALAVAAVPAELSGHASRPGW